MFDKNRYVLAIVAFLAVFSVIASVGLAVPSYSDNSTNSTTAGEPTLFSLDWEDSAGLSGYIFSLCNGTWNGTECLNSQIGTISSVGTTSLVQSSSASGSTSVTVPSGANFAVIGIAYWASTDYTGNTMTLDGQTAQLIEWNTASSQHESISMYYVSGFSSGSQTFTWEFTGGGVFSEGATYMIMYFSGVDTTNPIRDHDSVYTTSTGMPTITTPSLDTSDNDLLVGVAGAYNSDPSIEMTGGGQTELTTAGTYNGADYSCAYVSGASSSTMTADLNQGGLIAASLIPAYQNTMINDSWKVIGLNPDINTEELDGYWSMDFYNSTGVFDNSTSDNFGTFSGSNFGTSNITDGKVGNALDFDGSDDYVDTLFNGTEYDELSISAWIKSDAIYGQYYIVDNSPGSDGFGFRINSANLEFFAYSSGVAGVATASSTLSTGTWYHVVAVHNTTHNVIYVNGDYAGSTAYGASSGIDGSSYFMNIGAEYTGSNYFNGIIDELVIYNRSLTPDEILENYLLFNKSWSNVTKTLNSTIGSTVAWRVYANDTSDNWNASEVFTLTTTGDQPPQYSDDSTNNTVAGQPTLFSLNWTDDTGLDSYIFSYHDGSNTTVINTADSISDWSGSSADISVDPSDYVEGTGSVWANSTGQNYYSFLHYNPDEPVNFGNSRYAYFWIKSPENWLNLYIYDEDGTEARFYSVASNDAWQKKGIDLDNPSAVSGGDGSFDKTQIDFFRWIWAGDYSVNHTVYVDYLYANPTSGTELFINDTWVEFENQTGDVIFKDGFETGDMSVWTDNSTSSGSLTEVTGTTPYHGDYNVHFERETGGSESYVYKTLDSEYVAYARAYFNIETFGNYDTSLIWLHGGSTDIAKALLTEDNGQWFLKMSYRPGSDRSSITDDTTPLSTGTWYCVELYVFVDGSDGEYKLYLDGEELLSVSGIKTNTYGPVQQARIGFIEYWGGSAVSYYADRAAVSNSYIGLDGWSYVTKTINSTVGTDVKWRVFANDTSDNWNASEIFTLTTTDGQPPQYSTDYINNTLIGEPTLFSLKWIDSTEFDSFIFSTNNTGEWVNDTSTKLYSTIPGSIFFDDFESNDYSAWDGRTGWGGTSAAGTSDVVHYGDYSMNFTYIGGSAWSANYLYNTFDTNIPVVYMGLYFNAKYLPDDGNNLHLGSFVGNYTNDYGDIYFLYITNNSGTYQLKTFSYVIGSPYGSTYNLTEFNANEWYWVQMLTDCSNGIMSVWWGDTLVGNHSVTPGYCVNKTMVGMNSARNDGTDWVQMTYMDDVAISDSYIYPSTIIGWSNTTKTLNSTVGSTVGWRVYANDTDNNWNASEVFTLTTTSPSCDSNITSAPCTIDQSDADYILGGNLSASGGGISFADGVHNTTLDCLGYSLTGDSNGNGVYMSSASTYNNTIKNCIIANFSNRISIEFSDNNTIKNNILTSPWYGSGIVLYQSDDNVLYNNTVYGSFRGLYTFMSSYNNFTDNYVYGTSSSGVRIGYGSSYNNFTGGTSNANDLYDYSMGESSGSTNYVRNTNFTGIRSIGFSDDGSWFNYNNKTDGDVWLKTKVSSQSELVRDIVTIVSSRVVWNDNASTVITATYNLTGLMPDTYYNVYNDSSLVDSIQTDSNGDISFTIYHDGEQHEIMVREGEAPKYSSNSTNNTMAGYPTRFSLNWTDNVALDSYILSTNNTGTWENESVVAFDDPTGDAILFDGFESGDFSGWDGTVIATESLGSTLTIETDTTYSGQYAARAYDGMYAGNAYLYNYAPDNLDSAYARVYFYFEDIPSSSSNYINLITFRDMQDFTDRSNVRIMHDGTSCKWRLGDGSNNAYGTDTVQPDTWYYVELYANYTTGDFEMWVNGVSEASISGGVTGETVRYFKIGMTDRSTDGSSYALVLDSAKISDSYIGPENTWSNVTKTINSTVGSSVAWRVYANDTSDNWNVSEVFTLTTTTPPDTTPPQYYDNSTNITSAGEPILFSLNWTDNVGLDSFIFSTNNTGTWINETQTFNPSNETIDNYDETNSDNPWALQQLDPSGSCCSAISQSFMTDSKNYNLTKVQFYMRKVGSPIGNAHAKIYLHDGTYGTNSVPSGTQLDTSYDFDVSTLSSTYSLVTLTFHDNVTLDANQNYTIAFHNPESGTIDVSNYVQLGTDSSGSHSGNIARWQGSWSTYSGLDLVFYVYGDVVGNSWSNITKTLNSTVGSNIAWRVYANDTSDNWNASEIFELTSSGVCDLYVEDCSVLDQPDTYYCLDADITNSPNSTCFSITAPNVTIDCQSNTVDGVATESSYAFYSDQENSTIANCDFTQWGQAYLNNSNNSIVNNINMTGFDTPFGDWAFSVVDSDNVIVSFVDVNTTGETYDYGFRISGSDDVSVENLTSEVYGRESYASGAAFSISTSAHSYIVNTTVKTSSSTKPPFSISPPLWVNSDYCDHTFVNVVDGYNGKPIVFYNESVTIEHWNNNFSQMILCDADNSVINNITMDNIHGIRAYYTSSSEFTNIHSSNYAPTDMSSLFITLGASDNYFANISGENTHTPLYFDQCGNQVIENLTSMNNEIGIKLRGWNDNINLTGGSVWNNTIYDYQVGGSSSNFNITDTNFTVDRKVYLNNYDGATFKYRDSTSNNIWLITNLSQQTENFTRSLFTMSQSMVKWNDTTNDVVTATYDLTGLLANTYYNIYNDSSLVDSIQTDSNGELSFTIDHDTTEVEIRVQEGESPQYSNNFTNTTTAGEPTLFSLNWTDNVGLDSYIFSTNNTGTWINASLTQFGDDTFNDNNLNTDFWDYFDMGSGIISESNQRLEVTTVANADLAGLVTKSSYDLSSSDISVDVNITNNDEQNIWIVLTKVTDSNPWNENNWYRFTKYNSGNSYVIQRRVDGSQSTVSSGSWSGSDGYLRVKIFENSTGQFIQFFEESVLRHEEFYALPSMDGYVYITLRGVTGHLGTDYFDNFNFTAVNITESRSIITNTLNSTVGSTVGWRVYANDTSDNWNASEVFTLTTTTPPDTTPPQYYDNSTNTTSAGEPTLFSLNWTDNTGLSNYIFSTNNTGEWVNDSLKLIGLNPNMDTDDLIAYWSMDWYNSSGAFDNSSYSNFGTFTGPYVGPSSVTDGKVGNAMEFDGSGDYLQIDYSDELDVTDELTIEAWIKTDNVDSRQGIVTTSSTPRWALEINTLKLRFFAYPEDDSDYSLFGDTTLVSDTWYHVAAVYSVSGGYTKVYINGIEDGNESRSVGLGRTLDGIDVGRYASPGAFFDGIIDEVSIYNRSLTQDEIMEHYLLHNSSWTNVTKALNSTVGSNIAWRVYANDTSDNWNASEVFTLTTTTPPDTTPPQYSNNSTSNTAAGESTLFSLNWTDDTGLDSYIFSTNNTGEWVNDTLSSFLPFSSWSVGSSNWENNVIFDNGTTEDQGDHYVKIGIFADNFDDGDEDWTEIRGTWLIGDGMDGTYGYCSVTDTSAIQSFSPMNNTTYSNMMVLSRVNRTEGSTHDMSASIRTKNPTVYYFGGYGGWNNKNAIGYYGWVKLNGVDGVSNSDNNLWKVQRLKVYEDNLESYVYSSGTSYESTITATDSTITGTGGVGIGNHLGMGCMDDYRVLYLDSSGNPKLQGNLTSIAKDAEQVGDTGSVWGSIRFQGDVPSGTSVNIYANTSADDSSYSTVLVKENAISSTSYTISSAYQKRYMSWIIELTTENLSITPSIYDVIAYTSGSSTWSNVTKILTSSVGQTVGWRVYANDTSDNWNASEIFTLTTTDVQSPQYYDNSTNTTSAGEPTLFSLNWTDNVGLDSFIFSTNNTGEWVNDTLYKFESTLPGALFYDGFESGGFTKWDATFNEAPSPEPSTQTLMMSGGNYGANLTTSAGWHPVYLSKDISEQETIYFRSYVMFDHLPDSDTDWLDIMSIDSLYDHIVRVYNDEGAIRWQIDNKDDFANHNLANSTSSPVANTWYSVEIKGYKGSGNDGEIRLYVDGSEVCSLTGLNIDYSGFDNVKLRGIVYAGAGTEIYFDDVVVDDSYIGPEISSWSNITKTLNSTVGSTVGWRVYANDTSDNWNQSEIFTLTTTDGDAPQYFNNSTNNTYADYPTQFSLNWTDNVGLDSFIFSTNNTGTWINDTGVNFGYIQEDSADVNTSDWTSSGCEYFGEDIYDYVEGNASLNCTGNGVAWNWMSIRYNNATDIDISSYRNMSWWGWYESTSDTEVRVYTDWDNYAVWDISVTIGQWEKYTIDLNSPDSITGTPDLTSVDWISIFMNQPSGGEVFRVDDLRFGPLASAVSNVTKTLNSTVGSNIAWRIYANDTSNNWNASEIFTLTTTHIPDTEILLWINGTSSDYTTTYGSAVNITALINTTGLPVTIMKNGTIISTGETYANIDLTSDDLTNATYNITANFTGNSTYSGSYTEYMITVNKATPVIILDNETSSVNTSDLVGYWRMEDGTGTIVNDYSGYGHDGTLTNSDGDEWTDGLFGGGVEFDGSNDYVSIDAFKSTLNVSEMRTDFTTILWFKTTCNDCGVYSVQNDGHDRHIYLSGGNICQRVWNDETICTSGIDYADGNWHQVVQMLESGVGQKIYVDGVEKASGVLDESDFDWAMYIYLGYSDDGEYDYLDGSIDEVMIFNRTLTSDEISELYQNNEQYGSYTTFTLTDPNSGDSDVTYKLYRNDTLDVTSTENSTATKLPAGINYYVANTTGGQNYTESSILLPINVSKSTPIGSITMQPSSTVTYPTETTVSGNLIIGDVGTTLTLKRDGDTVNTGTSPSETETLGSGTYEYTLHYPETQNYTYATIVTNNLYVNKGYPVIELSNDTTGVNTSQLLAYWRMEEGTGTAVSDYSGYSNDGTLTNSDGDEWTDGMFGKGLDFDGNDDVIRVADDGDMLDLQTGESMSVSVWVKFSSSETLNGIIGKGSNEDGGWYITEDNVVAGKIEGCVAGSGCATSDEELNDNKWHYLVYVMDDIVDEMALWVDGIKQADTETLTPRGDNSNNLTIGQVEIDSRDYWNGAIDEVMIFNRSLTEDEITALYQSTVPYGTGTTFTVSESNTGDSDVTYRLYRNDTLDVTSTENASSVILPAGMNYYVANTTGGANYTESNILIPVNVTPIDTASYIHLAIDGSESDAEYVYPNETNVTAWVDIGAVTPSLYRNSTYIGNNNPQSDVDTLGVGAYEYIYNTSGTQNYSSASVTRILTITQQSSSMPYLETNTTSPVRGDGVGITARLAYPNNDGISGKTIGFTDETTSISMGSASTNDTGYATLDYNIPSDSLQGTHSVNATFNGDLNVTETYNDSLVIDVYSKAGISISTPSGQTVETGDHVLLEALVTDRVNSSTIIGYPCAFYDNSTLLVSTVTNSSGYCAYDWDTGTVNSGLRTIYANITDNATWYYIADPIYGTDSITMKINSLPVVATPMYNNTTSPAEFERGSGIEISCDITDYEDDADSLDVTISIFMPNNAWSNETTTSRIGDTFYREYQTTQSSTLGDYVVVCSANDTDGGYSESNSTFLLWQNGTITISMNSTEVGYSEGIFMSGYANYLNGQPITLSDIAIMFSENLQCNGSTDANGYYECEFQSPMQIGTYPVDVELTDKDTGKVISNSTYITVSIVYGEEEEDMEIAENVGCYQVPRIIRNPDGSIEKAMVKICVWK